MKIIQLLLVLCIFIGCSTANVEETKVFLTQNKSEISIINSGDLPVHYFLMESSFAAVVNISNPCDKFTPNLEANTVMSIQVEEIPGYSEESESFWFSWTDCKASSDSKTIKFK